MAEIVEIALMGFADGTDRRLPVWLRIVIGLTVAAILATAAFWALVPAS